MYMYIMYNIIDKTIVTIEQDHSIAWEEGNLVLL